MPDPRHQKLAAVLVHYSLGIKPGDRVLINTRPAAMPLVREIYRTALHAGAFITVRTMISELEEIKLREGSDDQLRHLSPVDEQAVDHFDVNLTVRSDENTKALSSVDPGRLAIVQKAKQPGTTRFLHRMAAGELRACAVTYPTSAYAQDAGMSLAEYEEFVYAAMLLNEEDPVRAWQQVHTEQQRIVDFLMAHDEIHIVAPGTDLRYRAGGRTWISCSGDGNFPDGEVFTGPIEDSANGTIRFSYPAVYLGNQVEDVQLTFEHGKVVKASAARGEAFLHAMLDQDAGARFLGEVAFGLNDAVKRFTGDLYFDEKIGGTTHLALGFSYPESGGVNKSALHWDMVCDLRQGQVFADGQQCYANGRFTI